MINEDCLPRGAGCYVLILRLSSMRSITVGRLGKVLFLQGTYLYVGSAFGSGGLRSRVGRHLRGDSRWYWHIDYLRSAAEVHGCSYTVTDRPLECEWAQALAALPNATIPMPHFGSSDCRSGCEAHLIAFPLRLDWTIVERILTQVAGLPVVRLSAG